MKELKKQLRKKYIALRNSIPKTKLEEYSFKILSSLFCLDEYKKAEAIFTYINTGSEIITLPLIEKALKDKKTVALPVVGKNEGEMFFIKITDVNKLKPNKYSILEPEFCEKNIASANDKTLSIIPGLVFSADKHRIGYGGGYYDRFMAQNKTLANIALAMDFQVIQTLPYEKFDISVDKIITQSKIY